MNQKIIVARLYYAIFLILNKNSPYNSVRAIKKKRKHFPEILFNRVLEYGNSCY